MCFARLIVMAEKERRCGERGDDTQQRLGCFRLHGVLLKSLGHKVGHLVKVFFWWRTQLLLIKCPSLPTNKHHKIHASWTDYVEEKTAKARAIFQVMINVGSFMTIISYMMTFIFLKLTLWNCLTCHMQYSKFGGYSDKDHQNVFNQKWFAISSPVLTIKRLF